uniref:PH_15 domain-containing protein n=1 Tax=Wuchereria bancrofti TaxID=6293 RepID=A0A1I8ECM3_WUCBA
MRLFRHNDDCISLPDQEALFSLPFVLFGHIEKKSLTVLGWRWRKRAVVLNPSGHLIIYKYFLEGIGAGKPFLGKIIHLDAAEQIHARIDKDVCYITIHDHTRKRTELRIKGTKARLWAAKVFIKFRRSTAAEIEWPIERSLKLLDSKISTSSIYDITLAAKANHMEGLSKITIASLSSESFPDYTTSDASHQNTQLSAQSMERVEISEMITACEADSESSNVENTSVQNGSLEASKSISLDQLNAVVVSRQDRFQKHFRSMIENRFYDNFKDYALNYSVSNIQNLRTQACSLRISQIYNEVRAKHQYHHYPLI